MKTMRFIPLAVFFILIAAPAAAIEFTADAVMTSDGVTHRQKIYMKDDMVRVEPEGQDGYTIIRQDKKVLWIVMPSRKLYMEAPLTDQRAMAAPPVKKKLDTEISRKLVGKDTVDGHPAEKFEITFKSKEGTSTMYQWIATDLDLPIKFESPDEKWSMIYTNIKTSVPKGIFELPSGYTMMKSPMMPGMGGPGGPGGMPPGGGPPPDLERYKRR